MTSLLRRTAAALALALLAGLPRPAVAQEPYTLRGTVVDAASQEPLPNVTVVLRGSGLQTRTGAAGEYSLTARVPAGTYTLQFALLGRRAETRTVTLGEGRVVDVGPVPLAADAIELDALVVTGTGAPTERRALGNTIATVPGEEVAEAPGAQTIDQALQGKVLGAVISENSGQPGGGVSIRLRGTSSILGGAEPLIVIDGVIVDNNSEALVGLGANANRGGAALSNRLADLSPDDVERVEVIKGAAAAALYGSRANNGVIQIFTRRGSQGAPQISLSTSVEVSRTPERYDLNMSPFAGTADVAFGDAAAVGDPIERFDLQDEIFRTGVGTNTQLSVSGGAEGTSYYLSGSYRDDQGTLESSSYRKASVRANLTQQLTDWLEVTARGSFIESETEFVPEGEQTFGPLTLVIFGPTSFDARFDESTGRFPYSPVLSANALDVLANWEAPEEVVRFLGNVEATVRPTDELTFRYLFGLDDYRQESRFFRPPFSTSASDPGLVQGPIRTSRQYNHDLTLTHDAGFGEGLGLSSVLGFRYSQNQSETTRAAAEGLLPGVTLIEGATEFASQSRDELRTVGGWLQERLEINDRIFLTGGLNVEAASAFGADERWQLFPRAGVSWIVDDEPFWENSSVGEVVSTLRLRGAYGETGGQPPGNFLGDDFYFGTSFSSRAGFVPSSTIGNPNLKPERQREFEGGFDLGLFGDRAVVEFSYYDQRTTDLVLPVALSPSQGAQRQFQNVGELTNRGVEVALNTVNLTGGAVTWRSRLGIAANRNRVEKLTTDADTLLIPGGGYPNAVIEGHPVGVFYGRGYERNASGDIVIDPATGLGERSNLFTILGDPNPDWTGTLSNTLELGDDVQFDVLLDGRFGNDVMNFTRRITEFFGTDAVVEEEIRRQVEGLDPRQYTLNARRISNYEEYTEDGSFVKLREISLRYRLRPEWVSRFGAESATLRLAGRNLYTWTDYSGLDPEVNLFSANTVARGVDFATVPVPRSFVFGLDLNF